METNGEFKIVPLANIEENKVALRSVNKQDEKYINLVDSVRKEGILNPILVRAVSETPGHFRLIDGLHRFSAAKDAGIEQVPVYIRNMSDAEILRAQIMANVHKIETRPVEYTKQLLRILAGDPLLTIAELAGQISKSPAWLNERLNLIKLNPKIQALVDDGKVNVSNAYGLAKLPPDEQMNFLERAMTQQPGEFLPTVGSRVKELRDAARKGKDASPEGFVPVPHIQKLSVLKDELDTPQIGPALVKETGVTSAADGFALGVKWVLHMDPKSVEAGKAKYEERKAEEKANKDKRAKEREEKKAKEAAEKAAEAAASGDLMHAVASK
jgi:ParB/RepB/Spo0J family partition protein